MDEVLIILRGEEADVGDSHGEAEEREERKEERDHRPPGAAPAARQVLEAHGDRRYAEDDLRGYVAVGRMGERPPQCSVCVSEPIFGHLRWTVTIRERDAKLESARNDRLCDAEMFVASMGGCTEMEEAHDGRRLVHD